jgi:two-component system, NarL family, response regulator DevR
MDDISMFKQHTPYQPRCSIRDCVRILIVDDHALVRLGLNDLIDRQPDMQVVAEASTAHEAITLALQTRPDLVLLDFSLPDHTGDTVSRVILSHLPDTKIVFLTVHEDRERVAALFAAGAVAYIPKSSRAATLLDSIRSLAHG